MYKFNRAILTLFIASLGAGCTGVTRVHTGGDAPDTLVVLGLGESQGKPQIARVGLAVAGRAATAEAALAESRGKLEKVVAALKAAGVADGDRIITGPNLQREEGGPGAFYPGSPIPIAVGPGPIPTPPQLLPPGSAAPPAPPPTQYSASTTIALTVRDLNRLPVLVEQAFQAGANQSWGLFYDVEDATALSDAARVKAVDNAKREAQQLAQASGVTLGRLLSVAEVRRKTLSPFDDETANTVFGPRLPFEEGQVRRTERVRLTYEIIR